VIFKQAGIVFPPPSQVNETLVWVAAVIIGGPGIAQLWQARSGAGTPTDGSLSSSPPQASSSSSSGAP